MHSSSIANTATCSPVLTHILVTVVAYGADIHLCHQASTRQRMIQYAQDQDFFFKAYADGFDKMGALGYKDKDLSEL
jgi:hypothetical protein